MTLTGSDPARRCASRRTTPMTVAGVRAQATWGLARRQTNAHGLETSLPAVARWHAPNVVRMSSAQTLRDDCSLRRLLDALVLRAASRHQPSAVCWRLTEFGSRGADREAWRAVREDERWAPAAGEDKRRLQVHRHGKRYPPAEPGWPAMPFRLLARTDRLSRPHVERVAHERRSGVIS